MEPDDEKTLTIAKRTRKNLEYIYKKKQEGDDVEEFTQLLNSMLGIIISLREDYFLGSHVTWEEIERMGLLAGREHLKKITGNKATYECPELQKVNTFSQLITRLRHGFAHNCYNLKIENRTITGIKIWNTNSEKKFEKKDWKWEADLSENDLKGCAFLAIDYLVAKFLMT